MRFGVLASVLVGCAAAGASGTGAGGVSAPGGATVTEAASASGAASLAAVAHVLAGISPERLGRDVARLAAFGTRHTLSETASETRGVGAARRSIEAEMRAAVGASGQVVAESHVVHADGKRVPRDVDVVDVVTTIPGTSPDAKSRRFYVVAHYDSRCTDVMNATGDAPGANDDASGVAILLELARVLSSHPLRATVVLLATAGEEQGLLGAKEHVAGLAGHDADVRAVLNDDIVGDPAGGNPHVVRVFAKGDDDSPARELQRFVAETAARERLELVPELVFRADRVLRGGDHLAFAEAGIAAVRFTASAEDYTRQHQDVRVEGAVRYGDLPERVDPRYLAAVARVNAATIVHLAEAPDPPADARLVAELSNDALLRWSPGRDPSGAGYEVVWRATTSATWDHVRDVGQAQEARLPVAKDDSAFGVRAYDARGFRSVVAAARPVAP